MGLAVGAALLLTRISAIIPPPDYWCGAVFANSDTQLIDQDKIDRHIGRRYKHGVTTLKKADYKDGVGMDQRCTMIGFREGGAWHFYYQRRADDLRFVPGKGSELVQIAADQSVKLT